MYNFTLLEQSKGFAPEKMRFESLYKGMKNIIILIFEIAKQLKTTRRKLPKRNHFCENGVYFDKNEGIIT